MSGQRIIVILLTAAICLAGCKQKPGENRKLAADTDELTTLYQRADSLFYKCGRIDTAAFGQFIRKAQTFADAHPDHEQAPKMLYRAGIGSMILAKAATNRVETAEYAKMGLAIFQKFQQTYPDDEHAKYCYYQRGIIYDDILGDWRSAEDQFRDFINRYPEDSLATQLSDYLKLLGKTEAQLEEALNLQ